MASMEKMMKVFSADGRIY